MDSLFEIETVLRVNFCFMTYVFKDPQKSHNNGYLDCGWGLVRVAVIYLEYTDSRGQPRVHRFYKHRKSLRPEEYIWKLRKYNVSSAKDYIK